MANELSEISPPRIRHWWRKMASSGDALLPGARHRRRLPLPLTPGSSSGSRSSDSSGRSSDSSSRSGLNIGNSGSSSLNSGSSSPNSGTVAAWTPLAASAVNRLPMGESAAASTPERVGGGGGGGEEGGRGGGGDTGARDRLTDSRDSPSTDNARLTRVEEERGQSLGKRLRGDASLAWDSRDLDASDEHRRRAPKNRREASTEVSKLELFTF